MSNINSNQLFRRNGSPSVIKQGPIRATKQFGLSSPSRNRPKSRSNADKSPAPRDSTTTTVKTTSTRSLSETCILSEQERSSPSSSPVTLKAASTAEKPKGSGTRRSNSFENLMAPYLSGQWPKDGQWQKEFSYREYSYTSTFTADKQTQTPDSWSDQLDRRKAKNQGMPYKRTQSMGSNDQLKTIKHKLQRNGSHSSSSSSYQSRLSPSLVVPPASSGGGTVNSVTQPIKIPSGSLFTQITPPRGTPGKARASVEGLNQEVEKLIISGRDADAEEVLSNVDGHRAPVVEILTRTTDTQTPSEPLPLDAAGPHSSLVGKDPMPVMFEISEAERSSSQNSDASQSFSGTEDSSDRCASVSPSYIPGQFEMEEISVEPVKDFMQQKKLSSYSPCPNSEFIREPPDGAERVKCVDEVLPVRVEVKHLMPSGNVRFQPSATSAFCLPSAAKQNSTTISRQSSSAVSNSSAVH